MAQQPARTAPAPAPARVLLPAAEATRQPQPPQPASHAAAALERGGAAAGPAAVAAALAEQGVLHALDGELGALAALLQRRREIVAELLLPGFLAPPALLCPDAPPAAAEAAAANQAAAAGADADGAAAAAGSAQRGGDAQGGAHAQGGEPAPLALRLPGPVAAAAAAATLELARAQPSAGANLAWPAAAAWQAGGQQAQGAGHGWATHWAEVAGCAHPAEGRQLAALLGALSMVDAAIARAAHAEQPQPQPQPEGDGQGGERGGGGLPLLLALSSLNQPQPATLPRAPAGSEAQPVGSCTSLLAQAAAQWRPAACAALPASAALPPPAARPYLSASVRACVTAHGLCLAQPHHSAQPLAGALAAAAACLRGSDVVHVPMDEAEAAVAAAAARAAEPAAALRAAAARLPGRSADDLRRYLADRARDEREGAPQRPAAGAEPRLVACTRPPRAAAAAGGGAANGPAHGSAHARSGIARSSSALRGGWERSVAAPACGQGARRIGGPSLHAIVRSHQLGSHAAAAAAARTGAGERAASGRGLPLARHGSGGLASAQSAAMRALLRTWAAGSASTAPSGNVVELAFAPHALTSRAHSRADEEADDEEEAEAEAAASGARRAAAARRRARRGHGGEGAGRAPQEAEAEAEAETTDSDADDSREAAARTRTAAHRQRLAVAATREPHSALVLDLMTGCYTPLGGHGGTVSALQWSVCGRWLVTASYAHAVCVWEGEPPHALRHRLGHMPPAGGANAPTDGAAGVAAAQPPPAGRGGGGALLAQPAAAAAAAPGQPQLADQPPLLPLLPLLPVMRQAVRAPLLRALHPTAAGAPPAAVGGHSGHSGPVDCLAAHRSLFRSALFASGGRDKCLWLWDVRVSARPLPLPLLPILCRPPPSFLCACCD